MAKFTSADLPTDSASLVEFLKGLSPAQLAEAEKVLNTELDTAQDRKNASDEADPDLAAMTIKVEQILAIRAETEGRVAESSAKIAEAAKLRSTIAPKATTEAEPADEPAPDAEPTPDDDGGDAGEESPVPADVEAVAASMGKAIVASIAEAFAALPRMENPPKAELVPVGGPSLNRHLSLGAASQYAPDAQVPARRGEGSVLVASADIPGFAQGTNIDDSMQLANILHHRARMMGISHNGDPTPALVASMNRTFKHRLDLDSPMDVIEQVLRDATDVDAMVAAGGWCFSEGTSVLTPLGLRRIEDIAIGDEVVMGSGNIRPVSALFHRTAQVLRLKANGADTRVTPEHPMWARRKDGNGYSAPAFIKAGDLLPKDQIAFLAKPVGDGFEHLFVGGASAEVAEARAYLLGRYLGDGWTSRARRSGSPSAGNRSEMWSSYLCDDPRDAPEIEKALITACVGFSSREYPTVTQFKLSAEFRDFVLDLEAGNTSGEKQIPGEVFGWPEALRAAVLKGYKDSDGCVRDAKLPTVRVDSSSISRELVHGVAILARTLGHTAGVGVSQRPTEQFIEGRLVQCAGEVWRVRWTENGRNTSAVFEDGHLWCDVLSIDPQPGEVDVYDFTVDDAEHTFVADGMVVSNCAPSEISYDFFNIVCEDGMIDLPSVGVLNRGGFRFPTAPTYADVINGSPDGLWTWTETDDQSAVTGAPVKDCVRVPCPSFNDVRLACDGFCVTAGNLIDFAYPENVANWIRLVMATRAHVTNSRVISILQAASTAVVIGLPTGGVYGDLMDAVALSAADYRARFAMCNDAILEVILPTWIVEAVQTDWARRDTSTDEVMTRDRLMRGFDARNVRVQFVQDYQVRTSGKPGASSAITTFPAQGEFMIYAPGTFVRGQGLQLNLGVVRDSVLNATNDMTAAWAEDCYAVAQVGHLSRKVTFNICVAGTIGARNITC